jgi:hypothetical protein
MEVIASGWRRLPTAANDVDLQDLVELLKAETPIEDLTYRRSQGADCRLRSSGACS